MFQVRPLILSRKLIQHQKDCLFTADPLHVGAYPLHITNPNKASNIKSAHWIPRSQYQVVFFAMQEQQPKFRLGEKF
jgi:hypothetical protein